jgi:hypothetical protein
MPEVTRTRKPDQRPAGDDPDHPLVRIPAIALDLVQCGQLHATDLQTLGRLAQSRYGPADLRPATFGELAVAVGRPQRAVRRSIDRLVEAGIVRFGSTTAGARGGV